MSIEDIQFLEMPIQRLSVKPGDIVILKHPDYLSLRAIQNIRYSLKQSLPEGVKVVVLEEGMDIKILEKAHANGSKKKTDSDQELAPAITQLAGL